MPSIPSASLRTEAMGLAFAGTTIEMVTAAPRTLDMRTGATRMPKLSIRLSLLGCLATLAWNYPALADGSSTPYGGGGRMAKFDAIIGQYNASGELFRIEGHCQSSCTMFLAIRNVCVDANANLL